MTTNKKIGCAAGGGLQREVFVSGLERESQLAHVHVDEDSRSENMTSTYARALGNLLIRAADEADRVNSERREASSVERTA
jgi:hypothetical protein